MNEEIHAGLMALGFRDTSSSLTPLSLEFKLPGRLGRLLIFRRKRAQKAFLQWMQFDEAVTIMETEDLELVTSAVKSFLVFIRSITSITIPQ